MIDYAIFTDPGEKERNEDSVKAFANKERSVCGFVLADGLGGHGNGDIASRFVVDCIGAAIKGADGISGTFIDRCFAHSQRSLMEEKERTGHVSIKTTLVLLLMNSHGVASWGHIGDSRLYLFRNGKVLRQTLDHSVPQMLVASGQIKAQEIRRHPERGTLLRAMGAEWDAPMYEIDERRCQMRKGDAFLLCSDGFWEWIEEKSMITQIKEYKTANESLMAMAHIAKTAGKGRDMDNFSAILIKVIK